jgi:transposase InsO family protein
MDRGKNTVRHHLRRKIQKLSATRQAQKYRQSLPGRSLVQTAEGKLYLYVAIDRTSKFAFVKLVKKTGRSSASAFLEALIAAVPYKIHTVLTDNGIQFTFPPRYADGPTARYMTHMFDMRCEENGIEHRLTKVRHPWTNGQVERMNRTIKEATVKRYHYDADSDEAAQ